MTRRKVPHLKVAGPGDPTAREAAPAAFAKDGAPGRRACKPRPGVLTSVAGGGTVNPEEPTRPLATYRGFNMRFPTDPPEHLPLQPSWTCANCAEEWPCEAAKKKLLDESDSPTQLAMLMWRYLDDYLKDQGERMKGSFERFLSWTRMDGDK